MRVTVLVDNNTLIDRYLQGEPAVCYFVEADGRRVLFDTGYSDLFVRNAGRLGIDLLGIDDVVLSHGHLDHTWGLFALIRLYTEAGFERRTFKRPRLVAPPEALRHRSAGRLPAIALPLAAETLARFVDLRLSREPVPLSERLTFLGEIERVHEFETREPAGAIAGEPAPGEDDLLDDTALAYQASDGLVVLTGCSHAGICNIVDQARRTTGESRVADIVGGLHLLDPAERRRRGTIDRLRALQPRRVHACHCTDLRSKLEMGRTLPLEEVGVGLRLEYEP